MDFVTLADLALSTTGVDGVAGVLGAGEVFVDFGLESVVFGVGLTEVITEAGLIDGLLFADEVVLGGGTGTAASLSSLRAVEDAVGDIKERLGFVVVVVFEGSEGESPRDGLDDFARRNDCVLENPFVGEDDAVRRDVTFAAVLDGDV